MKGKLIFVTSSPRRIKMLKRLNIKCEFVKHNYNEQVIKRTRVKPEKLAVLNARKKVASVEKRFNKQNIIITGIDTLINFRGHIAGKPASLKDSEILFKKFSNRKHSVVSGIYIKRCDTGEEISGFEKSSVYFKKLDEKSIKSYLSLVNPLDKAGGYAIQEYGFRIIKKISGNYDNVVGLPLCLLDDLLFKLTGFSLVDFVSS